jgi:putative membrane protein insertion efficiency factor
MNRRRVALPPCGVLARTAWRGLAACPRHLLIGLVKAYRLLLKPWLGQSCRFEPTCSQFALHALERHGALVGSVLTTGRLLRCHPWCDGGCDEVPQQAPGLFRRLGVGGPAAAEPPEASPTPPRSTPREPQAQEMSS